MTTSNPTTARAADASNAHVSAADAHTVRTNARRGVETKPFYRTTEFIVFIVATAAVLLASFLVKTTDGHADYFQADKAWLYVVILSVGYMVSRGLAKSGTRHREDV
ncbi:hypothetical protein A5647_08315 [Mycobacterium sp. 1100029.7]|nr:hypothetical protein A5647_08315 [Mycobacterium sp. 1100029.7]